jgi:sRNA-binding carbon storage regulator CsrA
MFVCKRMDGERIRVGEVVVHIVESHGGSVKVGVEAPPEMLIVRLDEHGRDQRKGINRDTKGE